MKQDDDKSASRETQISKETLKEDQQTTHTKKKRTHDDNNDNVRDEFPPLKAKALPWLTQNLTKTVVEIHHQTIG